jgi:hypothetical protein
VFDGSPLARGAFPYEGGKKTKATWNSYKKLKFDFFFDDGKCFRRELAIC